MNLQTTGLSQRLPEPRHCPGSVSIRVSPNELAALLRRLFEVLSCSIADFDQAAKTVVWLEMHGLEGVDKLLAALTELQRTDLPAPQLQNCQPQAGRLDACDRNMLCIVDAAADIAIDRALNNDKIHLTICNTSGADFIVPALARCGNRGLTAAAWWQVDSTRLRLARSDPPESVPSYATMQAANGEHDMSNTIEFYCARDPAQLTAALAANLNADPNLTLLEYRSATQLKEAHDNNLDAGIVISNDHYRRLTELADHVLVEASDASRRGAGD